MLKFTFTKQQRLLKSAEFAAVKGTKLTVSTPQFLLLARPSERARLGLAIAKRYVKLAVDRNTIKRVSRESFRHQSSTLPKLDMVLLTRPAVTKLNKAELKVCIDNLFQQLTKRYA